MSLTPSVQYVILIFSDGNFKFHKTFQLYPDPADHKGNVEPLL
jgi:hypothetical protein